MSAKDPILSQIPITATERRGASIVGGENNEIELQMIPLEMNFVISMDAVKDTNISEFLTSVDKCADQALESYMPKFFEGLSEACIENTFDAQGQEFSHDLVIDMIDRMEMSFDENDNPRLPTLCVNPEVKKIMEELPWTEEHRRKIDQILERKRAEYIAQKRVRKLY